MPNWRGTWSAGTAYVTGDSVTYGGVTWYAASGSTGQPPGTGSAWALADSFTAPAGANATGLLRPVTVKTGAYTAHPGDFVPVDASGGSVTITLPAAPADRAVVAVKMVAVSGSNTVSVACGGTDRFNVPSTGSTSGTLKLLMQGMILQYDHALAIWYVQSDDLPLGQLDARYQAAGSGGAPSGAAGGALTGTYPNPGLATAGIGSGGTGQTTAAAAITALTGSQTAGKVLRSDGTNATLASLQASDVPVLNQSTTGTAAGLSATLGVSSGGTGQVTQQAAIDALSGTQSAGKVLRSDGTHATLASLQAGDVPTLNQSTSGTAAGLSSTLAIASGGTSATTAAAALTSLGALAAASNLSDLASASSARANLGLSYGTTPADPAYLPSDLGYLAWNLDPGTATGQGSWTAGLIQLVRINVRQAITTCTGVIAFISVAGGTLASCFAGLYSSAGAILGTSADQSTIWTTAGVYSCAFGGGAISLSAGTYWAGYVVGSATTIPSFARIGAPPSALIPNAGFTASTARWATASGTAHTSLTAFTPSASTLTASEYVAAIY